MAGNWALVEVPLVRSERMHRFRLNIIIPWLWREKIDDILNWVTADSLCIEQL